MTEKTIRNVKKKDVTNQNSKYLKLKIGKISSENV